jgi:AraC-like DNA-binding protein
MERSGIRPSDLSKPDTRIPLARYVRQTLFCRLKAERVTFEQVLDDLRRKLALELPDGKRASVSPIAYQVGFSDPASYSRAFKRWAGESPRRRARGS